MSSTENENSGQNPSQADQQGNNTGATSNNSGGSNGSNSSGGTALGPSIRDRDPDLGYLKQQHIPDKDIGG